MRAFFVTVVLLGSLAVHPSTQAGLLDKFPQPLLPKPKVSETGPRSDGNSSSQSGLLGKFGESPLIKPLSGAGDLGRTGNNNTSNEDTDSSSRGFIRDQLQNPSIAKPISEIGGHLQNATDAAKKLLPFETRYYSDYYYGGHKLFREVIETSTNERLHCSYVGDRDIIAGLVGDTSANFTDSLREVLPTKYVEPLTNVTSEVIDDYIESCLQQPPNATDTTKPGLRKFISDLSGGAKNIASYMFIFPGTKWCGAGDVARSFDDLGPQNSTDRCCRDHDHSPESIRRGQTHNGLKNPLFYTITNCNHDDRFRECLIDSSKAHSSAVGTLFFNILKTKCFDKRKQAHCTKKIPLSPCQSYTYDENSKETWQIFDPVKFTPNSSVPVQKINDLLYVVPGVDNIINLF